MPTYECSFKLNADILNWGAIAKLIFGEECLYLSPYTNVSIKKVIFNAPATIVYWSDGEKTVVKANNEHFDKEKGLAMAIVKRAFGNTGRFNEIFKRYCDDE